MVAALIGTAGPAYSKSWTSYLFNAAPKPETSRPAKKAEPQAPVFNSSRPRESDTLTIADFEPRTQQELMARGNQDRALQFNGIRKMRAETRQKLVEVRQAQNTWDRQHEEMMAIQAKRQQAARATGNYLSPAVPVEDESAKTITIYNKPGLVKPPKVFTDFR
jgi:hypothetical protein